MLCRTGLARPSNASPAIHGHALLHELILSNGVAKSITDCRPRHVAGAAKGNVTLVDATRHHLAPSLRHLHVRRIWNDRLVFVIRYAR